MLDFDFKFRWGRTIYILILSGSIAYWFSVLPGLICMLAVIDITFESGLFDDEPHVADPPTGDQRFGPNTGDHHVDKV